MFRYAIYILFLLLLYSCAPINKIHGYTVDDILYAIDDVNTTDSKEFHKNHILESLGSPSIKIKDV